MCGARDQAWTLAATIGYQKGSTHFVSGASTVQSSQAYQAGSDVRQLDNGIRYDL